MTHPTNPVVDAVAEREAELIDRLTVRANILHASAAWGSDADALLMQRAAKALARHRQSADAALVEALEVFRSYGCPRCNGDCGSANPPVMACPMQMADLALRKRT